MTTRGSKHFSSAEVGKEKHAGAGAGARKSLMKKDEVHDDDIPPEREPRNSRKSHAVFAFEERHSEIENKSKDDAEGEGDSRSYSSSVGSLNAEEEQNFIETLETKNLEIANSTTMKILEKKGVINFGELIGQVASKVLAAYMGFKDPMKRRREYLIPKDKAAWLEWLVQVATKRINVEYLTDKELRKVIIRARPNLAPFKPKYSGPVDDPDLPPCIGWDEEQVGDWITSIGWPSLRETFIRNKITGRRLVLVDCSALNKMGMSDLASMRDVAGKIRDLLGIPPPNALRPLMHIPPYERFLRRKVYTGRSYDEVTFKQFCETEGFNYEFLQTNKNAQIPCTTEVLITTPENAEDDEDEVGEDDEEYSLKNAPTVEFLVRNALVRNKLVDQLMEDIMENVFLPPRERKYGKEVWGSLKRGIGEGFDDLYLYYPKERLDFASDIAHSLIDELYKTVAIMNDISQLERHIKEKITEEEMEMFRNCAQTLIEEAVPIAALLALGELDLENIFKQEPTFEKFVGEVVHKAEKKTNLAVPDASRFVDDVISTALKKIGKMDLSKLNPDLRNSLLKMTNSMLDNLQKSSQHVSADKASKSHDKEKTESKHGKHENQKVEKPPKGGPKQAPAQNRKSMAPNKAEPHGKGG